TATGVTAFAQATGTLGEWRTANDYDHINLIGRVLSALFDTLTVLLIFLLGRRVYNQTVGLVAAALVAFTVQQIQLAHFYAFDTVTTTVIVAALYFGVRVVQDGGLADSLALGAMVALAVASKFSALPLAAVIFLAHALRPIVSLNGTRARPVAALGAVANPPLQLTPPIIAEFNRALTGMLLSLFCALMVFAVVSPFTFLDFSGYQASLSEQSDMVRGLADFPYTRQYRNTGLGYWVENFVFWATGPLLGIAALGGLALVMVRAARRTASAGELLILAWVVPYAAITLSFQVKFLRYLVPLTPFLVLMGAYGLWRIAHSDWRTNRLSSIVRRWAWLRYLPLMLLLIATAAYAFAFLQIYTQPLTRVTASEWIYRNIPAGSAITDESWDDSLPLGVVLDGRGRSFGEYREVQMNLHEPDDARKLELLKTWLRQADYVIISSNRMYGWLPRLEARFPITKRYYDLLFAEKLGFSTAAQFTSYPRLGALEFDDDHADESFTVYDHPKVLIYKKTRGLSDAEFSRLFADAPAAQNPQPPVAATNTRDKSLMLDRPVDQLPVVNDRAWNAAANASQLVAVAWWWLVVQLLGLIALPLALTVFHRFADGGYIFAKSLGLLLVAYVVWLLASVHLVIQNALVVWLVTLLALAISVAAILR
ncbi:MAG: glycosyltransferase family 39 protein, partial [Chloroflexi bacterium]|nr:glycosyltransferase family 39 protein [Chloroflexota bacterium]